MKLESAANGVWSGFLGSNDVKKFFARCELFFAKSSISACCWSSFPRTSARNLLLNTVDAFFLTASWFANNIDGFFAGSAGLWSGFRFPPLAGDVFPLRKIVLTFLRKLVTSTLARALMWVNGWSLLISRWSCAWSSKSSNRSTSACFSNSINFACFEAYFARRSAFEGVDTSGACSTIGRVTLSPLVDLVGDGGGAFRCGDNWSLTSPVDSEMMRFLGVNTPAGTFLSMWEGAGEVSPWFAWASGEVG